MTERLADTISGTVLLFLAVVMGTMSTQFRHTQNPQFGGPGTMPLLLSICLGLIAIGILIEGRSLPTSRRMPGWSGADLQGAIRIGVVLAATAGYNLLLQPAGYIITSALYLLVLLWYLKVSWKVNLIITFVCVVFTYALFDVYLKVVLPMGPLEIYF